MTSSEMAVAISSASASTRRAISSSSKSLVTEATIPLAADFSPCATAVPGRPAAGEKTRVTRTRYRGAGQTPIRAVDRSRPRPFVRRKRPAHLNIKPWAVGRARNQPLEHNPVRWSRLRCAVVRRSARRGAKGDAGASAERRNAAGARLGGSLCRTISLVSLTALGAADLHSLEPAPWAGTGARTCVLPLSRAGFSTFSPLHHKFRGTPCHRYKKRLGLSAGARALAGPWAPHPLGFLACGPNKKRGVRCNPTRRSRSASMSHEVTQRRTRA